MKKKVKNILETSFLIISVLICLFAVLQRLVFKEKSLFGYRLFVIVTSSMQPELYVNDVILVKEVPGKDIKVGDNITYTGVEGTYKDKVVTHKVETIEWNDGKRVFITKGLQNTVLDPPVTEDKIHGRMEYKFITLSFIRNIIGTKYGFYLVIVIPLLIILLFETLNFKKTLKNVKNNDIIKNKVESVSTTETREEKYNNKQ